MTLAPRPAPGTHAVLRAACFMAVLVGIFGMHGLANHGARGADMMPHNLMSQAHSGPAVMDATDHAQGTGVYEVMAVGAAPTLVDAQVTSVGSSQPGGMDMSMTGLCLAVLIIGFGTLSLWFARRRRPLPAWVLSRAARARELTGRVADPPSLQGLSIRRC